MPFLINPFLGAAAGPTFFPTDIPGLIRWYKASDYDGAYADGAMITTPWLDNSTAGEDAVPQAGDGPLYKNTILSGGQSSILINTGTMHFDTTQMVLGTFSVVAFWKPNADTILTSDPSGNYQIRERSGGVAAADWPYMFPNGGSELDAQSTNNTMVFHVRAWTRDGVSGVPFFYYNKIQQAEQTGQTNTTPMVISTISLSLGGPANHDLVELLVYTVQLTQGNIDDLFDGYYSLQYPDDL